MKNLFTRFIKEEDGVTAIEYGLIAGLIAVLIIGAFTAFGTGLTDIFTDIGTKLTNTAAAVR